MVNNSSSSLSNTPTTPTVHVILNIISLTASAIGTLLSFVTLTGFLLRKKTFHDVQLLLCTNNFILVFVLGIFKLMDNVNTLRGDFGLLVINEETLGCRIEAYIIFSLVSAVYLACVLQAVFRLCRIVYPSRIWLLNARAYLIIIPLLWCASFILVCPLYIWHGHKVIPDEYICRISKDDPLSIVYSTVVIYVLPFNGLAYIYFQVHRFLRRQATAVNFDSATRSLHRARDILVFRRIVIIVTLLGSYGMPNLVMLIILAITGQLIPSFYRILELSFAVIVLTLSVALFYVSPQLRQGIRVRPKKNRVVVAVTHDLNLRQRTLDPHQLKMTSVAL